MGLESFKTSSSNRGGQSKSKNSTVNHDDAHEAYKIIWNGDNSLPIEDNEVVVDAKEEWEEIATFINKKMGISNSEFNSKPRQRKYEIVKDAKKAVQKTDKDVYSKDLQCTVCGKTFTFPDDWDFVEFDGNPSCPTHTVDEYVECIGGAN